MRKSNHGGSRRNAGRKPKVDKKIQLTIYVEKSKIVAAGGLEMAKKKAIAAFA